MVSSLALRLAAQSNQGVYADSLQNGWEDWSWATINFQNVSPIHGGSNSISVSSTNWQALYLHHAAQDASLFTNLTFWVNGGAVGGQLLHIQATRGSVAQTSIVELVPLPINYWRQDTVSLASLGVATAQDFDGFWLQVSNSGLAPTFYVDDVTLVDSGAPPPPPITNSAVTVAIDAAANRHPISPLVYGVAFASSNQLLELNAPLNRSGGNAETRYNWQLNAHNRAADWYFESLADSTSTPGAAADDFVANSRNAAAQPMVTIPMIAWPPKLGPSRGHLSSYSIAKYGAQTGQDPYWSDAGDGIASSNGADITGNDPNDASFPTNSGFQRAFVGHLTNQWGLSTNGGVPYYLMDNEPSIWHSTHRDIHPVGATMQEIRDKFFDYAAAVKAVDPAALIAAPEEWGWSGYFYSGYDQQYGSQHGWSYLPDRATNGGWDYLPWLIDQMHQRATNTNQRLLDLFTVHYYPQSGEYGNDVSTATQLLRNRSTRSLWDTNYIDASWINSVVKLIPRLKSWAATYYPGTKIGITEYNWGAEAYMNGATAQADIFGVFGREGLDLATRWTTPDRTTPTFAAMKMYRNYDGNKSAFGDVSVSANAPNPDSVSAFAAIRSSDGALTAMLINKQLSATATATMSFSNFMPSGAAQIWQLVSSNVIARLNDVAFTGTSFTNTLPQQSITLFVMPAGNPPILRAGRVTTTNNFDLRLDGQAGQKYILQTSTNLVSWSALMTNMLSTNSLHLTLSITNSPYTFYRAKWTP